MRYKDWRCYSMANSSLTGDLTHSLQPHSGQPGVKQKKSLCPLWRGTWHTPCSLILDSRASSRSLSALRFSRCHFSVLLPLFPLLDKLEWVGKEAPFLSIPLCLHHSSCPLETWTAFPCCPTERSFIITFFLLAHRLFCHKQSQASFPAAHISRGGRGSGRTENHSRVHHHVLPVYFSFLLRWIWKSLRRKGEI